jgi:hypothetical protein
VFESRAQQAEILDQPDCDPLSAEKSYRFMRFVNRYGGGGGTVCKFITRYVPTGQKIKILDLGSGMCDVPLAVLSRFGRQSPWDLDFTCLEINSVAIKMAQESIRGIPSIRILHENIFSFNPDTQYDYAIGSLFFHHLSDQKITELLHKLRSFVKKGILINDLHRSPFNYATCWLAVRGSHRAVRHDALLSIQKGFTKEHLRRLLNGPANTQVHIESNWFFRISAAILFDTEQKE